MRKRNLIRLCERLHESFERACRHIAVVEQTCKDLEMLIRRKDSHIRDLLRQRDTLARHIAGGWGVQNTPSMPDFDEIMKKNFPDGIISDPNGEWA